MCYLQFHRMPALLSVTSMAMKMCVPRGLIGTVDRHWHDAFLFPRSGSVQKERLSDM
jgi:hypothetical protein